MCVATATMLAAAAAAATIGAVGSISQGNSQANAYKYNALVEEQNAEATRAQANAQAGQQEQENRRRVSEARAAYGASGVDPNQGTPLDLMSDLAMQGELSRQLILYGGEVNARQLTSAAALDRANAKSARLAGYVNAATTLLSAGSKGAGTFVPSSPGFPDKVVVTPRVTGSTY